MGRELRLAIVVAALLGALILAPGAGARGGAGHNPATKKLEDAFKVALYVRSVSTDGCYPPAKQLAKKIGNAKRGLHVGVANGPGSVRQMNKVFVLKHGTTCNKVLMALRASSGLYILNSAQGTIRVQGRGGPRVVPGKPGPPRRVRVLSKTFKMSAPDQLTRHEVLCGRSYPIGGGMTVSLPPGPDGEGIYPHSYERLGAQRGFHVSAVLYDADRSSTTPRNITVQAVCAQGLIPQNPTPHKTVFIKPGETKTAIARCPKGQYLITGGFQRTNFASDGGNYVTESRAVPGMNAWQVSGSAFTGSEFTGGGELTAIAYCVKHRGPILTEAPSLPVPVPAHANAAATSPPCPAGLTLTTTGFSLGNARNAFYGGNSLNDDGTTTATAFGYFGDVAGLTSFGYCLRAK